ncbi:MAG: TetR/AcrR family transcriptional regulator [Bacteroidales bacterium]|nr:TetR/AcrR family transcriptional regulator [Bacteroidales bacterium]
MTKKTTQEKILIAARKLFTQKGMSGTRMQEIADEAEINKALLHYYFRSKDILFESIFIEAFSQLFPKLKILSDKKKSLEEKIKTFVCEYFKVLQSNPFLPLFILQEIQRDPENLYKKIKTAGFDSKLILENLQSGLDIPLSQVRNLMINVIGLCVFPFAAKPLLNQVFFENNNDYFDNFIEERKKNLPEFIMNCLNK